MKKEKFPTIKELQNALMWGWELMDCNYNQSNYTFEGFEPIYVPVRDSGGSIDSIDVRFEPVKVTFFQAYQCWKDLEEIAKQSPVPAPVAPVECEEIELPF